MTRKLSPMALGIYVPLSCAAFVWCWKQGRTEPWSLETSWMAESGLALRMATSAALGVLLAWAVIGSTRWLVTNTTWAQALNDEFARLLKDATPADLWILAMTSSIGEELFFRGAMTAAWGVWVSSLVFGLAHMGPTRVFWPWTFWACLMGFAFAIIFVATGSLLGCLLAHFIINFSNMRFIQRSGNATDTARHVDVATPPT